LKTMKWILIIAAVAMGVFLCSRGILIHSNHEDFQKTFGVKATQNADLQAQEVPVIIAHVGMLRQSAVDSWNHSLSAERAVEPNTTFHSSLEDAKREAELIKEAQAAKRTNHVDYDALTWACSMLKGEFVGIPIYPVATRGVCPQP
jgi:hypothetical protein